VPEQELLQLAESLASSEPLGLIEAIRTLLERGREPSAVLQGLAGLLRDLVLAGVAPDRLELTSFSPQFRNALPDLARRIGKAPLLRWQAQLKGSEQQLRQSVQPRLWLEVLLLGLLAEPQPARAAATGAAPAQAVAPVAAPLPSAPVIPSPAVAAAAAPVAVAAPATTPATPPEPAGPAAAPASADLVELWQQILAGLELPSTRMLLSQQAVLARLDQQRAVVQVAGNWMAMVQSRLPLLEKAVASALGSPRQVMLEAGGAPPPPAPAPAAQAPITAAPPQPVAVVTAQAPEPPRAAAPAPRSEPPQPIAPPAEPPSAATPQPQQTLIDDQAKRLAEFFNGEVVQLDGPLPELEGSSAGSQAA
jgi:DNA polymerase-3 subunit gamma/tau